MTEVSQGFETSRRRYEMAGFAFSIFSGILTASIILPGIPIILGSFLLSGAAVIINRKSKSDLKSVIMLLIFLAGMLDYSIISGVESKLNVFDGNTAVYECLITDNPAERGNYCQYPATILSIQYEGKRYNFSEKIFLRIDAGTVFKFGNKLSIHGQCSDISGIRNPGDFDYKLYYKSKGINKQVIAEKAVLLEENDAGIFKTMLYLSRDKVRNAINQALPEEEAAILIGIITGDKTEIDEDMREAYMKTGLSHILSVSGLHVGFLMLLLTYLMMPFRPDRRLQGFLILLIIVYYVLLIGAPLPSVRALIMLAVLIVGKGTGREYDLLASVSFAFMVMLVFKPLAIHDTGFMISFAAMYSIALIYPSVSGILRNIPSVIKNPAALSMSVWLGLAPVLAYYFNYISIISIIINIIAIPLSFIITVAGFIGVFTGIVSKTLSLYVFSVDYYFINLLSFIIQKAAELPIAGFYVPKLPVHLYALYYGGISLFIGFFKSAFIRIYIHRLALIYLLAVVIGISAYNLPSGDLKMIFFDVGQGDSCCIITPHKKAVLIDGGGSSRNGDYYYDVGGKLTLPALLHQGIWSIDTVIVSHLHDDHMEGLLRVMEVYRVKNIVLPKVSAGEGNISKNSGELLNMCGRRGVKIYRLGKGDNIILGQGIRMDFLQPGENSNTNENENSLIGLLSYKEFNALFTGDMGKEAEDLIQPGTLMSFVMKVPHHGSGRSSSKEFLDKVKPRVSIISVGNNNFGHPSGDTIKRLVDTGSLVYRTDESGAVTITTDGENVRVKTVKEK